MLPLLDLPVSVDDVVGERGGPWEVVEFSAASFPMLQTALPSQIVYKRTDGEWTPHLLIAESCILRRVNARGMGVYALRRFRGPREVGSALGGRREAGDEIGWFGGAIVGAAPTRAEADERASSLVRQGRQALLTLRVAGKSGWFVVDGNENSVRPFLNKVNDPRGTQLAPRCEVSEFGCFRAARGIPAVDMTRPLWQQVGSELSFDYGEAYWGVHDRLGTSQMPLEVERSASDHGHGNLPSALSEGRSDPWPSFRFSCAG